MLNKLKRRRVEIYEHHGSYLNSLQVGNAPSLATTGSRCTWIYTRSVECGMSITNPMYSISNRNNVELKVVTSSERYNPNPDNNITDITRKWPPSLYFSSNFRYFFGLKCYVKIGSTCMNTLPLKLKDEWLLAFTLLFCFILFNLDT